MTPLRSDIAWSTADRIVVRGYELPTELLGRVDLGQMAFLMLAARLPTAEESAVFNALAITLVEHGITPSALATRLTYLGAPESVQAAVAAGLLGLGSRFVGSIEDCARLLQESLEGGRDDLKEIARERVADFRARNAIVPGIGHPFHKPIDPRAPRLFEIAAENGFSGRYVELIRLISAEAERVYERELPVNATGAIAALASELGLPWRVCRGLGVMARAIGLVGHVLEESEQPIAREVWLRVDEEASRHAREQ